MSDVTIHEILKHNIIVISHSDTNRLVTACGSNLSLYEKTGYRSNGDVYKVITYISRDSDFYNTSAAELCDEAEAWFNQLLAQEKENGEKTKA